MIPSDDPQAQGGSNCQRRKQASRAGRWLVYLGCFLTSSVAGWLCWRGEAIHLLDLFPPEKGSWPMGWVIVAVCFTAVAGCAVLARFRQPFVWLSLAGFAFGAGVLASVWIWCLRMLV